MNRPLSSLVLWLFVINLGIAFGAGLYESRILVPQWLSGSPESGYRVSTFAYFIPTMIRLMRPENLSGVEAVTIATQWVQLDYVRNAITLVAWLSALKAFALFHQRSG